MSNPFVDVLYGPYKKIELVKKIASRTREGKIFWQKTENGVAAYVPGAMRMNFVEAPWSLFARRWVIFAIRDEAGNELLKVENQSSAAVPDSIGTPIAPPSQVTNPLLNSLLLMADPLSTAVTDLFSAVQSQEGKPGVDKAIDFLNNL